MDFIRQPYYCVTHNFLKNNITFHYPNFYTSDNTNNAKNLNEIIRKTVYNFIEQMPKNNNVRLLGNYEIKTNLRSVVSLVMYVEYDFGGKEAARYIKTINFNADTLKAMELHHHFSDDSSYILAISRMITDDIERRNIKLLEPKFTKIEPNEKYYITDKSIVILFDMYDITPYSEGFPYFVIPIDKIKHFLKESSPLNRLINKV